MKKNLLLTIASLICTILCILITIVFLIGTCAFVYWHINPDYFADFILFPNRISPEKLFAYEIRQSWTIGKEKVVNHFTLNRIRGPFLYLLYLQSSAICMVLFLIPKEFLNIIESVRTVHSFRNRNVQSFRRIGKCIFIYFILTSFWIVIVPQGRFYGFYLNFTPLVLMLIAYILGEVFKEGNNLFEENKLTV